MLQFIIVIITCGFLKLPAFGQMTPYTYSDAWGDENGGIYGCSVTDEGYNSYNHQARAISTLTSPNGRVVSHDTGFGGSYACAQVYLPLDWNDVGIFSIIGDHEDYCPFASVVIVYGTTSTQIETRNAEFSYKKKFVHSDPRVATYERCNAPYTPCREIAMWDDWFVNNRHPQYTSIPVLMTIGGIPTIHCSPRCAFSEDCEEIDTCISDRDPKDP